MVMVTVVIRQPNTRNMYTRKLAFKMSPFSLGFEKLVRIMN